MTINTKILRYSFVTLPGAIIGLTLALGGCGQSKEVQKKKEAKSESLVTKPELPTEKPADPLPATAQNSSDQPGETAPDSGASNPTSEDLSEEALLAAEVLQVKRSQRGLFEDRKYELITPTGEKLMAAALKWQAEQEKPANAKIFAQPAQCATNISKVMGIAGFPSYNSPLVPGLVAAIKAKGGLVIALPKDRAEIAKVISETFDNKIPTGTLVGGCLYKNCSGNAGDGHIAMVGDIDQNGAVQLYHNNWYRPDNENGVWKPQMIPMSWYNQGYRRKFMATSWMNIFRDPPRVGTAYDVSIELPAIDDLDPTNYYVTLAVPVEVWKEYKDKKGKILDRDGNQVPMEVQP
jgi:hypothetical protein